MTGDSSLAGGPAGPVRAIVVDDSRLMRRMLVSALEAEGTIKVVAEAADAAEARALIREHDPQVITLDVEMPGMNGLEFLRRLMALRPMPVVMVSTLTGQGADISLGALELGAVDAILKPSGRPALAPFARRLRRLVLTASGARVRPPSATGADAGAAAPLPEGGRPPSRPGLLAMGASTGGVAALTEVLRRLPADAPPVVLAQHMPAAFTARFAARLDKLLPLRVTEARGGEVLEPGTVLVAPGDRHLRVRSDGAALVALLEESGPISGHRPSVDVLFHSVATAAGPTAVGVLLTGMGRDGAAGMHAMRTAGAWCIGQSEDSCVVYGMPRAARALGSCHEELDPPAIGARISGLLRRAGSSAPV
ncbi:chemotaxis-specific protein-glutamate methyltransferase CheB [Rhodobacteraceae bacterium 2CG4]|uniref:Protein-glutamate methylesterase/protein-glutamine glutaminase n=1 Tax=Halovulum marinum TaxID=2662447 RepID=A0A6L5YYU1_9RHOB|nr:chemotaxis-specific protein-glutamate methyltransferase CheB [Halovulum marinum]MSU89456.1 chemotaxis-specific protein-glutamate methyltransferase CheB [Halovulum marinum]